MIKYKIALLDDKSYWIDQIKSSIPWWIEYDFYYFDSYKDIVWNKFDIIFLDYYLDKDWITWVDIIHNLNARLIIWFSSVSSWNKKILENWWDYEVLKLRWSTNVQLEKLLDKIFLDFDINNEKNIGNSGSSQNW